MRVTTKGQVTIPRGVREALGISPGCEIEFIEENGRFYFVKINEARKSGKFNKFRGIATVRITTDELMSLTRELRRMGFYWCACIYFKVCINNQRLR
jgi:antitoxin PrlF